MGRGSFGVAIPRDWLRFYGLEPGDEVEVVSDGDVTIRPVKKRAGEEGEGCHAKETEASARPSG